MSANARKTVNLKVTQAFTEAEIGINGGENYGITRGAKATVIDSVPVIDPETGDELGTARVPRYVFEVTAVSGKYSIARIVSTWAPGTGGFPRMLRVVTKQEEAGPGTALVAAGDVIEVELPQPAPAALDDFAPADDDLPF